MNRNTIVALHQGQSNGKLLEPDEAGMEAQIIWFLLFFDVMFTALINKYHYEKTKMWPPKQFKMFWSAVFDYAYDEKIPIFRFRDDDINRQLYEYFDKVKKYIDESKAKYLNK